MLVDQGLLDFDAPVTKCGGVTMIMAELTWASYLTNWKLKDPSASENVCLRDMMSQYALPCSLDDLEISNLSFQPHRYVAT